MNIKFMPDERTITEARMVDDPLLILFVEWSKIEYNKSISKNK